MLEFIRNHKALFSRKSRSFHSTMPSTRFHKVIFPAALAFIIPPVLISKVASKFTQDHDCSSSLSSRPNTSSRLPFEAPRNSSSISATQSHPSRPNLHPSEDTTTKAEAEELLREHWSDSEIHDLGPLHDSVLSEIVKSEDTNMWLMGKSRVRFMKILKAMADIAEKEIERLDREGLLQMDKQAFVMLMAGEWICFCRYTIGKGWLTGSVLKGQDGRRAVIWAPVDNWGGFKRSKDCIGV